MCSLSIKALKCHRSNIKNQLKNLKQRDKRPINQKCVCILIRILEYSITVLLARYIFQYSMFIIVIKGLIVNTAVRSKGGILD